MEFLKLVKETKKLSEDIKRQRKEFNLKIKGKVKEHTAKKKEIEEYLKEIINSREYEYREVEVKSGKEKIKIYYPFLKLDDAYKLKKESFRDHSKDYHEDYYDGLHRKYTLYNKSDEIKVKEYSVIRTYKRGSNEEWNWYLEGERINSVKMITYKIEIEGMKFQFVRFFDVSKI